MSASYPIQATFGKGELSPLAYGRVDVDFFRQSLERCRNFSVMIHGGLRRRSGTRYVAPVVNEANESRLFPFSFNNEQSYVLDINAGGDVQFLAQRGYLGAPYTVSHPWTQTAIARLSYTQFNDIAYFAERDFAPRKLQRNGDTDWDLTTAEFEDGPYLPVNTTTTTLTPAETGRAVPFMTSNTAPAGYVASSTDTTDAYQVFDGDVTTEPTLASGDKGFSKIDLGSGNARVVDAYWVQSDAGIEIDTPTGWVLEGSNDDSTYVVIDRQQEQSGWGPSEIRYYDISNETAYRYYRLTFTGGGNADGMASTFSQIVYHWAASDQTPFNLTASSITGINDGGGFKTSDVGRNIRIEGSDGRWRWCEIVSRVSSTVVTVRMHGHALIDLSPIRRWRLGAFSEESGWPALVELYDERLNLARTDTSPVTVWGSKQGAFDDFGQSDPLLSTDGYSLTFLTSNMNELVWIAADEDLLAGSAKQVRAVGPADTTAAFSATNITQRKGPSSGAFPLQPLSIGGTVLYAAAGGKKVRELILGEQGRYVAPDISVIGEHTLNSGIVWWTYSENPEPTIYIGTEDGEVVAILYDREQRAIGFCVYEIAGGVAESGAVIPSQTAGYDDLYMVVSRSINGSARRYIEVLEHPFHHINDVVDVDGRPTGTDGFFVDCGLTYTGAAATTITGLGHLEGETVVALADGAVVEDLTVSGGEITLPYAAETVHVGLAYTSTARTHRFAGPGRDGYLFGRRVKQMDVYVDVLSTGALKVGAYGDSNWTPDTFEINPFPADSFTGNPVELVTGVQRCEIEGSWAVGDGRIVMETDAPLPCHIRLIELQAEQEP